MFLEHSGAFLQRSYVSFLSTSSEEDEGTALNSQTLCFFIGGRVFTNGQNEPRSYKLFLMDRICDFSFQIRNCSYRNIQPHHIVHLNISYLKYWLYIALILNKGCNNDYTSLSLLQKQIQCLAPYKIRM